MEESRGLKGMKRWGKGHYWMRMVPGEAWGCEIEVRGPVRYGAEGKPSPIASPISASVFCVCVFNTCSEKQQCGYPLHLSGGDGPPTHQNVEKIKTMMPMGKKKEDAGKQRNFYFTHSLSRKNQGAKGTTGGPRDQLAPLAAPPSPVEVRARVPKSPLQAITRNNAGLS